MKFLCICAYGHSRSVALTRAFHSLKYEAVAVGCRTSPNAIPVLGVWADYVCVLQPHYADYVPAELKHKVIVMDVGPDVWSNPYNEELYRKVYAMAEAFLTSRSQSPSA